VVLHEGERDGDIGGHPDDHDGAAFAGDGDGLSHRGLDGDAVHNDVGTLAECRADLLGAS
jgi:hypothetical protein